MKNLVSTENLIQEAKNKGINFGKGDPYNRLRYYTKIGWLPHMIRKKSDSESNVLGHYPKSALNRLILIEKLKAKGTSNEEISKRLSVHDKMFNLLSFFTEPENRNKLVMYLSFAILIIILANELEIIHIGKSKRDILLQSVEQGPKQILNTGTSLVLNNRNKAFVKDPTVNINSKIYITFNQDFSPATKFWVSEKVLGEGFYLSLDAPTSRDAEFSWWITE